MVPYLFNPREEPDWYPLYKVYMGFIIKGTIPRVPPFSLSNNQLATLNSEPGIVESQAQQKYEEISQGPQPDKIMSPRFYTWTC